MLHFLTTRLWFTFSPPPMSQARHIPLGEILFGIFCFSQASQVYKRIMYPHLTVPLIVRYAKESYSVVQ